MRVLLQVARFARYKSIAITDFIDEPACFRSSQSLNQQPLQSTQLNITKEHKSGAVLQSREEGRGSQGLDPPPPFHLKIFSIVLHQHIK